MSRRVVGLALALALLMGALGLVRAEIARRRRLQLNDRLRMAAYIDAGPPGSISRNSRGTIANLLRQGANVRIRTFGEGTVLQGAAFHGDVEAIEIALRAGIDVDERGRHPIAPLVWAAYAGERDAVELLLRRGANVNALAPNSNTPLYCAACYGHAQVVSLLLAHGADPNLNGSPDRSLLLDAVEGWGSDVTTAGIVRMLLQHGARLEATEGRRLIALAKKERKASVARLLRQHLAKR